MSILRRPNFYLWTVTAEVIRLERLYPTYEVIGENTEQPNWKSKEDVIRVCKSLIGQERKHPVVSSLYYRRMFVRIDSAFNEVNLDASRYLINAMEKVGALYVEIAKADDLLLNSNPLGPQETCWPMPIHYATSYWWP